MTTPFRRRGAVSTENMGGRYKEADSHSPAGIEVEVQGDVLDRSVWGELAEH
ncbi:MAG: hypothetical protein GY745_22945, partial [Actinomycetia bacterium]|nr:hypothetical protein [Actinomycetes bacterium]